MTARRFSRRLSLRPNIAGLLTMAACGLAWERIIQAGTFDCQYLPAPSALIQGAGELVASGELAGATVRTLESVFLGWAIAVTAGVSLGLLIGFSPLLRRYSLATIEVLRPMPAIAFVPVALMLFRPSVHTELMVIVLPSLCPALINTMGGALRVHARLGDVRRTFRLSRAAVMLS